MKKYLSWQKVVQNYSARPNINFGRTVSSEMLRRKIGKGASVTGWVLGARAIEFKSLSEVNNFGDLISWIKDNILRFDIVVYNIEAVEVFEGIEDLEENMGNFGFIKGMVVEQGVKVLSLNVLHDKGVLIFPCVDLVEFGNVGMR